MSGKIKQTNIHWKDRGTLFYDNGNIMITGSHLPYGIKQNQKYRIQLKSFQGDIIIDPEIIITDIKESTNPHILYQKICQPEEQAELDLPPGGDIDFFVTIINDENTI